MNDGIKFAARPQKKPAGAVPMEVKVMARQLGISGAEMEEAESMWAKLTELRSTNREGYDELVKASAAHVQGQDAEISPAASAAIDEVLPASTLTPTPGFVVKCVDKLTDGKVMVNCCAHTAVQPPIEPSGREVAPGQAHPAEGLRVPMVVGEPRPCAVAGGGDGRAIDVVFNPWVLERCADAAFKRHVTLLALRWVEDERGIQLSSVWKHINSRYKGGSGPKGDAPTPCPLSAFKGQDRPLEKRATDKKVIAASPIGLAATPESLLERMRAAKDVEDEALREDILLPSSATPLVEEIVEVGADGADISTSQPLKKGFLASAAKPLYPPDGSDQGQKEGCYSRFMSKCKVVDTSTMSKEQQEAAVRAHAAAPEPKRVVPRDPAFDELVAAADPEVAKALERNATYVDPEVEETLEQLQTLAANFEPPPAPPDCPPAADPAPELPEQHVPRSDPHSGFQPGFFNRRQDAQDAVEILEVDDDSNGRKRLKVVVRLNPDVATFDDVHLDVADSVVKVKHPPTNLKLKVPLPAHFRADPASTRATFSKKHHRLNVQLTANA